MGRPALRLNDERAGMSTNNGTRPSAGAVCGKAAALSPGPIARWSLTITALGFLTLFLFVPLAGVFAEAFARGGGVYLASLGDPDTRAAIRLTALVVAIAVPLNTLFGLAVAWAVGKFSFVGSKLLVTLIDLPLAVSPVISGMAFVMLFGRPGWLGPWLEQHGVRIIFAQPGIVLVTMFVTLPLVARELVPLLQAQGTEEEQAARMLGAGGWQIFWRVTLPNIKWGVLYGVILCTARAMGEFGAVSVVSGHIRGRTNTMPLQVEILYNDYNTAGAFAVASLLTLVALVTLVVKCLFEWHIARQLTQAGGETSRR